MPTRSCSTVLYFDHNATSPVSHAAREAWLRATEQFVGNPSSQHRLGTRADRALEDARSELGEWLGCDANDLIFTSGATESNNCVFRSAATSGGEVLVSSIEHPSVLEPARHYFGSGVRLIPVDHTGRIDLAGLEAQLSEQPALVAVMAANNETGIIQPWREARGLCSRNGIPFLCDASQWVGKEPLTDLGACDFVTGCAHKFGGPPGVGFLKARRQLAPLLYGGPQENGRRAGTENVPGVLSMMAALRERYAEDPAARVARLAWKAKFEDALASLGATVLCAGCDRLWNTVTAIMPQADCRHRWVVKLDKAGVAVSTGSACASGKEKPSHVLTAMGLSAETASQVIRFSSGWDTTEEDWLRLFDRVRAVAAEIAL